MALLPVADAQKHLLDATSPVSETELLPLRLAVGRVLASDVLSTLTQPPFHASAMDGYAVRADDVAPIGSELTLIGTASAGHAFVGAMKAGETVRIFTGAPLPDGADTVLIQEDAERLSDNRIRTKFAPEKGRHVRPRGQDFAEGEAVLKAGEVLDAGRLTVAAAMNHPALSVLRKPRIAVLATGDELVPPGTMPGPSQIIASNTFGISALAEEAGADVIDLGIVPDKSELIAAAVQKAVDLKVDVLVTLGGASVGDHDLVQSTLKSVGMVLDFWKIAMRPGKPLMVGSLGTMRVLGLPGNPVSSMVCGLLFMEPLIQKLGGRPIPDRLIHVRLVGTLPENDQRQDYIRSELSRATDGTYVAKSFGKQDSSMMKIFANSGCLVIRPPFAPAVASGEIVPALKLREPV